MIQVENLTLVAYFGLADIFSSRSSRIHQSPNAASRVSYPSLLVNMPIHITSDAWARWQPVIEELYANYDFPFNTRRNLNALLALYGGEGFSIRNTRDRWRFVMDTIRSGDAIEDVVGISVIARGQKMGLEGWVISRKCDIHNVESPNKAVEGRDLTWFKVTSDGRSFQHCCREEVTGPFPAHVPWRSWESTRLTIVTTCKQG